ncbi:primosomal protein N' [Patescibacteria group bacterium]|nr:MAG: primosomal protein N' [Patescibacteria group bacterium]
MNYAEIIVTRRTQPNYQTFTYSIPKTLRRRLRKGQVVEVPFGRQIVTGVVLKTTQETEIEGTRNIKKIIFPTSLLDENQFQLAELISQYYKCALGIVIKAITPRYVRGKTLYKINYLRGTRRKPKSPKQEKVLDFLKKNPGTFSVKEVARRTNVSENLLKQMLKNHLVKGVEEIQYPDPLAIYQKEVKQRKIPEPLNLPKINLAHNPIYLIFDQSGNTKDKIYLEQIKKVISKDKQVLLIVPEISLTPAKIKQLLSYFPDQVAIWHSKLSRSHKMHQWLKIQSGEAKIIIGSRSSLFCPFKKLGLVILDNEHDSSYKQEQSPRYHARKITLMLNQLRKIPVILGSANPSVESYYATQRKKYNLIRIPPKKKPRAEIVDLTTEIHKGNRSIFSDGFLETLNATLQNKGQAVLFLNRRGSATLVICRECGHVVSCPRCDIPLVYHTQDQKKLFRCHHCYYQVEAPKRCPNCYSHYLNYLGLGTQKIEEEIKKYFPKAKILRIDKDSASKKSVFFNIYQKFQNKKADILIGTKMIQSFLHFPNVSFLGIVNADTLLNLPDFRNQEKTFQLLNQFLIAIQNKKNPGRTIIQTYIPNNLALRSLVTNNYQKLLAKELKDRRELNYPPFGQLIKLIYTAKKEEKCFEVGVKLKLNLARFQHKIGLEDAEIIGPTPAFIPKVGDQYRYYLILKGKGVRKLLPAVPPSWRIDIDPESLL